jgi:PPOX class probable F420-dependent enzyme
MTQQTAVRIPQSHRDLLEEPLVAHLATTRPDGTLQSNPVWFEWDGHDIKLSQTRTRQKMRNLEHNPNVALSITDPDNPYRYLELRGTVVGVEDDADRAFIDHLAQRYLDRSPYPWHQPGDERVIVRVRPTDTSSMAA